MPEELTVARLKRLIQLEEASTVVGADDDSMPIMECLCSPNNSHSTGHSKE